MLSDASRELSSKPSGLKKLGIDEIALIKDQGNYCAVLIDLETSKLITILKGRTQEEIEPILNSWGSEADGVTTWSKALPVADFGKLR